MRAITNRICRLEAHLAPHEGLESWRLANVLYERRRRRVEAAGEPFDGPPPERRTPGPRLSVVEMLRLGRQRAYERNQRRLAGNSEE